MGRKILFCFFLTIVLFSLPAETVFVYIEKGNIVLNNAIDEKTSLWITRIEDGMMDILFDNGHIVFSNDSGRNQIEDFEALNQLAKSGGASFLVSAILNLNISDEEMIISGEYKVYDLYTDDVIYENNYIFNDDLKKQTNNIEENLYLAGQSVAKQIEPAL